MINIRPVSDLRNKYPEIEELVLKEDEAVYLTKNGYGSMVVLSMNKYSKMLSEFEIHESLNRRFGVEDLDKALLKADEEMRNPKTKVYSHEEMKKMARGVVYGKKI